MLKHHAAHSYSSKAITQHLINRIHKPQAAQSKELTYLVLSISLIFHNSLPPPQPPPPLATIHALHQFQHTFTNFTIAACAHSLADLDHLLLYLLAHSLTTHSPLSLYIYIYLSITLSPNSHFH